MPLEEKEPRTYSGVPTARALREVIIFADRCTEPKFAGLCTEIGHHERPPVNLEGVCVFKRADADSNPQGFPATVDNVLQVYILFGSFDHETEIFYSSFCGGGPQGCNMRFAFAVETSRFHPIAFQILTSHISNLTLPIASPSAIAR